MTYSEVREMYTLEMTEVLEAREEHRQNLRKLLSLTLCWFVPWAIVTGVLTLYAPMLNAQKILMAFGVLSASFFYWKKTSSEENSIRLLSSTLSWLMAAAALATACPVMG